MKNIKKGERKYYLTDKYDNLLKSEDFIFTSYQLRISDYYPPFISINFVEGTITFTYLKPHIYNLFPGSAKVKLLNSIKIVQIITGCYRWTLTKSISCCSRNSVELNLNCPL